MHLRELAKRVAVVANVLFALSLLLTVISWHLSLELFAAFAALYAVAWALEGGAVRQELSETTHK